MDVPILTGEDIYLKEEFAKLCDTHSVDMIHPDLANSGGLLETKKIGDYAEERGVAMAMHFAGSPVCGMANVHCAAATRNSCRGCSILGRSRHRCRQAHCSARLHSCARNSGTWRYAQRRRLQTAPVGTGLLRTNAAMGQGSQQRPVVELRRIYEGDTIDKIYKLGGSHGQRLLLTVGLCLDLPLQVVEVDCFSGRNEERAKLGPRQ